MKKMGKKWVIVFSIILFLCIVLLSVKFLTKPTDTNKQQTYTQRWSSVEEGQNAILSLIKNQKYDEAKKAVDKLMSDFSGNQGLSEILYLIAEEYRWAGESMEASDIYKKIIQNFPQSWHATRAEIGIPRENVVHLITLGDYAGAQKAIDKMVADFTEHPDLPDALYWLADKYRWSDRHDEAKNLYKRIVQNYPDSASISKAKLDIPREEIMSLIVSGDYPGAQKAIDKLISDFAEEPDLPDALYWVAHRYAWCGEDYLTNKEKYDELKNLYDEAKKLYKIIIQNYPNNLYSNKAKLGIRQIDVFFLIITGDYTGAQKAIDKMATDFAKEPDLPDALYWIAHLYFFAGRYDEAKNLYQRIVQNYPNDLYANKAKIRFARENINCLITSGDYTGAQKAIDKMVVDFHAHPDLPENILYIASVYSFKASQIGERENEVIDISNSEEAQECLRKATEILEWVIEEFPSSPVIPMAYLSVARCYGEKIGEYQKAIDYYQKLVDNWPNDESAPDAYYHIGQYYNRLMRLGVIPKSSALLKIKSAYNTLIEKYSHSEFAEMAREIIQKGIQINPANINFGNINKGTTTTKKLYITKPLDEELVLLKIQSSSDYLSANFSKTPERLEGDFEVEVALKPNIPIGELEEKVIIYTTSEKYPKIEIPVTGNIKGDIEFHPDTFFLGVINKGDTPSCKVTLLNTGSEPLKLEKIDPEPEQARFRGANPLDDYISIAITPKTEGKEYELTATLKDNAPTGSIKGNIIIYTNNPNQPKIEIPVYGLIRE